MTTAADPRAQATSEEFAKLLNAVRALEAKFDGGASGPLDDQELLEAYKWAFSILQVGLDAHVWADTARPRFVDTDGMFEIVLSAEEQPGTWLKLEPDAVCAITRDYLNEPVAGRRVEWSIEAVDAATTYREDDTDLARRLRAARTWVEDQAKIVPLALGEPNSVDEPYPVTKVTFGWAAGDAAYAMGSFDLDDDDALVIAGRSPECAFWNICLWNRFLHTYNY